MAKKQTNNNSTTTKATTNKQERDRGRQIVSGVEGLIAHISLRGILQG